MTAHLSSYWTDDLRAERAARFGRFLVAWRKRCRWSQHVLPRWGEAANFYTPASGGVSALENGKTKDPEMKLFAGLAEANRRLLEQDLSGVKDQALRDKIRNGVPALDRDGKPWQFQQFLDAMHFPHLVSGEIWDASSGASVSMPELTDEELARVNDTLHEGLLNLAREVRPITKAIDLVARMAPPDQRDAFRDAITGTGYDGESLRTLWDEDQGEWAPLVWARSLSA